MFDLNTAIEIALKAHKNQKQKDSSAYILHPLRLMLQMQTEQEMITAVLHDVVEDSAWTINDLQQKGCPAEVLQALKLLTHKDNKDYFDYIRKIKNNPLARKVKLADLRDNMNVLRLPELKGKDLKRLEKYHVSWKILNSVPGRI